MPKGTKNKTATAPSDQIDHQLARYREMRDFEQTREPAGKKVSKGPTQGLPFVVQKHAATRLHYDFRLGYQGVLKSWAVTKGPSYVPADKRLAVQVEDHPMEYGGFEGTIPKGQYGGGTVMLWDQGTWEPLGDPEEGFSRGNLKFVLHGSKLRGKWALIRMGSRGKGRGGESEKPNWLLIKERDEYARTPDDEAITEEAPNSVATNRDLDAIARSADHVWRSNHPEKTAPAKPVQKDRDGKTQPRHRRASLQSNALPGSTESLPAFISPQLAMQASRPPAGDAWFHELKLDGYRIQAHIDRSSQGSSRVKLFTRTGLDWTHRMPAIARDLQAMEVETAIFDGEVVVLTPSGEASFALLQAAFDEKRPLPLTYFVFDLLHLNGHNLRALALEERKRVLTELLATSTGESSVRLSQHIEADGAELFREACRLGAEGIICKRRSSPYSPGRSGSWIKVKCIRGQEFVIGGYTRPANATSGVGALLLGYYQDGALEYAGRVGTGFTRASSKHLKERLDKLQQKESPFRMMTAAERRGAIWTDPQMVAEVQFRSWTEDHRVRQASFKGIREDKPPSEVRREVANAAGSTAAQVDAEPAPQSNRKRGSRPTRDNGRKDARAKDARQNAQEIGRAVSKLSLRRPRGERTPAIRVTHPDRIIDAETHLTKKEIVDYYLEVGGLMLPHMAERPLSLVRCPSGAGNPCFFQKHWTDGMPSGVEGIEVSGPEEKSEIYITLSSPEAIAELAQMNVLEFHPWGSTNGDLDRPDRLIFDLDPDEAVSWPTLCDSAREVRDRLSNFGLRGFLKGTGGKGLHIVAPLQPSGSWAALKAFAHAIALQMEHENPALYTSKMTKAGRKKKIYVDYLRNERGATAIAPYSTRARPGVSVAMPLAWNELKIAEHPRFMVRDFPHWLARLRRDPWKGMAEEAQSLPAEVLEQFS